jgi:hypothetical protein
MLPEKEDHTEWKNTGHTDLGYYCQAEVVLHGHSNCGCKRQHFTETIALYLSHPPEIKVFPAHYSLVEGEGGWLSQINRDGKFGANENSIGYIVKRPTTYSYGMMWKSPLSTYNKIVRKVRSQARDKGPWCADKQGWSD